MGWDWVAGREHQEVEVRPLPPQPCLGLARARAPRASRRLPLTRALRCALVCGPAGAERAAGSEEGRGEQRVRVTGVGAECMQHTPRQHPSRVARSDVGLGPPVVDVDVLEAAAGAVALDLLLAPGPRVEHDAVGVQVRLAPRLPIVERQRHPVHVDARLRQLVAVVPELAPVLEQRRLVL
eukprot:1721167-Rhodomonas_salina.1